MRRALLAFAGLVGLWACGSITPIDPNDGGAGSGGPGRGGSNGSGAGGSGGSTTGAGGTIGPGTGGSQGRGGSGGGGSMGNGGAVGSGGATGTGGTTGKGGSGGAVGNDGAVGTGGAGGNSCATCAVEVYYSCFGSDTAEANMLLDVQNLTVQSIPLSQITVRYWYTSDQPAASQVMTCDYAAPGCAAITSSFVAVSPARPGANLYFELGFTAAARTLAGRSESGQLQFRLHSQQSGTNPQTDDYSFDCSMPNLAVLNQKITAYVQGRLVWGVEP